MKRDHSNASDGKFLECERRWVYWCLIAVAGWFGAYTFLLRGGVFCNAQTANIVLFAMAVGKGDMKGALYLLIPISAYFTGAFFSSVHTSKRFVSPPMETSKPSSEISSRHSS